MESFHTKKAFAIIEIMLAVTLFALFSTAVVYVAIDNLQRSARMKLHTEALHYAQEGLEAARNMRDRDYLSVSNGDHGLQMLNDEWTFIAAPETIDGFFDRTVRVEDVYRDSNNNIAATGSYDPETKKITSQVEWTWKGVSPRSVTLTTYLSNWTADDWSQTTCAEFNGGSTSSVEVVNTPAPPEDNCAFQVSSLVQSGSTFASADVGEHGDDVVVDGNYAYVATAKTQTGLTIVDISDAENPLVIASLNIGGKGRYLIKSENYVYVSVEKSDAGLAIVDVANPNSPILVSTLDIDGEGNQPVISGNTLYMGVNEDDAGLAIIDVTNKAAPSIIDQVDVEDEVYAVHLNAVHLYLGLEEDEEGFKVMDISNPQSVYAVTSLDVGEEVNAIEKLSSFVFLGTEDANNSLKVVGVTDPENPSIIASLDVEAEIQDLSIHGDYLYAAMDDNEAGLAVIDISDPIHPSLVYTTDIMGKGTGIDADDQHVYITLDVNNRGLVIVSTAQASVQTSGTYTSNELDTGSATTRYNFIEWDHVDVPGGSVQLQLRTADTLPNIQNAIWVGPDGTGNTFYEIPRTNIVLDPNRTGVQFVQFKATLYSNGVTTPIVETVRINYNP